MGSDPDKEPPFFFSKAADQVVLDGKFPYPPARPRTCTSRWSCACC